MISEDFGVIGFLIGLGISLLGVLYLVKTAIEVIA